jgi:hypothetical protein
MDCFVICISSDHEEARLINQLHDEYANCALLRAGFLGTTPTAATVAISLDILELYHQIRRRQSSFSIQAMSKVLCALHNVSSMLTSLRICYINLLSIINVGHLHSDFS